MLGRTFSEESLQKMREHIKSDEHRAKLSKVRIGYKPTKEAIENWKKTNAGFWWLKTEARREILINAVKGKKKSPEHVQKMRELMKNRNYNNYRKGFFFSDKAVGGKVFYRSCLELIAFVILESDPIICKFEVEPFQIEYEHEGHKRAYRPDILVDDSILIEVKCNADLNNILNLSKFVGAETFCADNDLQFEVWNESFLYGVIVKCGELLGHLNFELSKQDYQQPISLKRFLKVNEQVQRLEGEDISTNKPSTSAALSLQDTQFCNEKVI